MVRPPRWRSVVLALSAVGAALLVWPPAPAGVYVTEASGIRWNDVGGIRWNDVGGIRWNDVGGIRWNDVGGIRWNDVGGILFTDASGIRWNDVGGIRWNDVGGILFDDALATGGRSVDLDLLSAISFLPDTSSINVVVTFRSYPTAQDFLDLLAIGIPGGTVFRRLPMVVVNATKQQVAAVAALPAVRSVYSNKLLSFFDDESRAAIGLDEVAADPDLALPGGGAPTGAGVTIAVLDTGVDATHPDLPYGSKVIGNVRLGGAVGTAPGFLFPVAVEGIPNTDLVLGHGTFVASVAAGTGAASGGTYRGVAPGASILSLSAGDLNIMNVLEGFDYVLENAARFGVRVLNCSWGTVGFFDPDDPVNVATRLLHDAGITVVFAAGNHGPSPDTLNPYAVAPWVIGVGSTRKDGALSGFSSRGVFEEILYHPTLVAPGEGIVAATPILLGAVGGVTGVADASGGESVPESDAAGYAVSSGTSFAAPHLAGVAALMLEARPTLTPSEIKRILQATATPMVTRDRSEVGAGRLDAWAALTQAIDGARPFGTHVAGWLDERPYRIEHRPAVTGAGVVPAGGSLLLPVALSESVLSWQMTLAWNGPTVGDLDLTVTDASGAEVARSSSISGVTLFGSTEGVRLVGSVPAAMTARVAFEAGLGLLDQPIQTRQETAVAVVTAYDDVAALPQADRDVVAVALRRGILVGRGSRFEPFDGLTRGELARALALKAGRPQRIPSAPTFADVAPTSPDYPYVETVSGARAGRVLIDPGLGASFQPGTDVDRLDFAIGSVRAAGLEGEAISRAGEALGLLDESKVPWVLRGYVAVALERGFIGTVLAQGGSKFEPKGSIGRLEAARYLIRQP